MANYSINVFRFLCVKKHRGVNRAKYLLLFDHSHCCFCSKIELLVISIAIVRLKKKFITNEQIGGFCLEKARHSTFMSFTCKKMKRKNEINPIFKKCTAAANYLRK